MPDELRFDGKVAIITGAGGGLGRAHALLLGSRGAKVIVNDLGGSMHGDGKSSAAADKVVQEIKAAGGEAAASYDSVEEGGKIVQAALDYFGRIDIVVNNAGILRDTAFHNMTEEDWDLIYRVHVLGGFRVTHAAWTHLRNQSYGRVVMTASAAGIYGNFGQANYSSAKLGLLGLSNTLAQEGRKRNILVNTIAPIAGSRLTETVLPKELIDALRPEYVSPLVAYLCHEGCKETGALFEIGGGFIAKLRWERSEGHTFRLGRAVTPELIAGHWGTITGFEKTTHPESVTQAMEPVLANIQAGPSKGGNDLIDVDLALGYEFPTLHSRYDERDLAIYALGVGAAADPLDDSDLRLVYELHKDGFLALPTFGVIPAMRAMIAMTREGKAAPGLRYGLDRLLHGEQYTEVLHPFPPSAKLSHKVKIKHIFDKGKHAVVVTEVRSYDEDGDELTRNEFTSVIRGAGGWGGDRGPSTEVDVAPERAPDATTVQQIAESQALLYRLSGDWNPLHADPGFASAFGFSRPILHGLCTFGYAARHVIRAFAGGDPRKLKSIKARFADSVYPGETLVTEMWRESDTRILFRCKVKERDKLVISHAAIELYTEIPQKKATPKPGPSQVEAAAPPEASGAGSDDVFIAMRDHVERHPELVGKIGTVFQFKLTGPDSTWTLDLKSGKGSVTQGAGEKPDCTLELTDADFVGMATGKLNAQKLYFGGKLKISGNVMASQKLEFLRHIDPEQAKAAVIAHRSKGGGQAAFAPATAAAPAAATAPSTAAAPRTVGALGVFEQLRAALAARPGLAGEVGAVVQVKVTAPESAWVLDFEGGKADVRQGEAEAAATVTLAEEDLATLALGEADLRDLFLHGKLRIDGDVRVAQRLASLKGLLKGAANAGP